MGAKGKKNDGGNSSRIKGSHNFVINPHSVKGGLHVHGGQGLFQNKKVRISVSIGGAVLLAVAGVIGWTKYRAASGELPLTVAVEAITPTCGTSWVVPRKPDDVDVSQLVHPSALQHGWRDWTGGSDGAAAASLGAGGHVQLSIQGRSAMQVVLTDMKVRVTKKNPPVSGTLLHRPCGDQWAFRWMDVDLDTDPPRTVPTNSLEPGTRIDGVADFESKPIRFPYRVADSDAETFMFNAKTVDCDCFWVVDIYWSSAGESGVMTIDDHGKPFRTSSDVNAVKCAILDTLQCE
ncbi:MAG TPA: hypothetical protein VNO31_09495 [Umezawaea sp.]|nr:hypothetical protein [Umezawaea sp.]